MSYIIQFLIIVVGFIIYKNQPKKLFAFWVISVSVLLPFIDVPLALGGYIKGDLDALLIILDTIRNLFAILVVAECKKQKRWIASKKITTAFFLIISYFFIWGLKNNMPWQSIWISVSEVLSLALPIIFFMSSDKFLPRSKPTLKLFKNIIIAEFLIVCLNVFGIYVLLGKYVFKEQESLLITATFYRYNGLGNFLSTIYLLLLLLYHRFEKISKRDYWSLSGIIILMVLLTGSKVSMVLVFLFFSVFMLMYNKHKIKMLLSSLAVCGLCIVLFKMAGQLNVNTGFSGLDRTVNELSEIGDNVKSQSEDNMGTLELTYYLFYMYGDQDPLFGTGNSKYGEYGYGNWGVCTLDAFRADSRVAYVIVEYGWIGLIMYCYFFFTLLRACFGKKIKRHKRDYLIVLLYLILLTFTEGGFFDRTVFNLTSLSLLFMLKFYNTPEKTKKLYSKNGTRNNILHVKNRT